MNLRLKKVKPLWMLTVSTLKEKEDSALTAASAVCVSASTAAMSTCVPALGGVTGTATDSASGALREISEGDGCEECIRGSGNTGEGGRVRVVTRAFIVTLRGFPQV
jgi:hypothetical protein